MRQINRLAFARCAFAGVNGEKQARAIGPAFFCRRGRARIPWRPPGEPDRRRLRGEGNDAPKSAGHSCDAARALRRTRPPFGASHPPKACARSGHVCGVSSAWGRALLHARAKKQDAPVSRLPAGVPSDPGRSPGTARVLACEPARRRRIPLRPDDASRERPSASGMDEVYSPIGRLSRA